MSILDIFKRKPQSATMKEPEWWRQQGFSQSTGAGSHVSPDSALQVNAVYACVRILSETIASLPLKTYQETTEGRELVRHPLSALLGQSPNGEQTAFEVREFLMTNLGLRGNSYAQVIRRGGRVVAIEPLNSRYMDVSRGANSELVFDYQQPGMPRVFSGGEIWRIAGLSSNGVTGMSPVTQARESIGIAIAGEKQAAKLFSNGAQIPGVLEFPDMLSDEQIEHLRTQFAEKHQGSDNAHKPLILESGMKYAAVGMSNSDAQFLESRKYQIADIARLYRVPLHMLNELDKATFSNIEHQSIEFVMHTIRPWLVRIEQSIARDLLTERERQSIFVSHSVEGLLRGDTKSRYESYTQAINAGWMSPNEARKLENRNPEDGLDVFRSPLNMASTEEREEQVSNSLARVVADKEIKAIKAEIDRLSPEQFNSWFPDFYDRQKKVMQEYLPVDKKEIDNYIKARVESLSDDAINQIPMIIDNAVSDIEALL